jgi:hypothetical protein
MVKHKEHYNGKSREKPIPASRHGGKERTNVCAYVLKRSGAGPLSFARRFTKLDRVFAKRLGKADAIDADWSGFDYLCSISVDMINSYRLGVFLYDGFVESSPKLARPLRAGVWIARQRECSQRATVADL